MNVLDTDLLTLLMHGHPKVSERVNQQQPIAITIVSRIEMLQGRFSAVLTSASAAELRKAQEWLDRSEVFIQPLRMLKFDAGAAGEFGRLRSDRKLRKIGRADLLIACIALAHRATLVTRNLKHFRQVPGLQVENWAD
jgi:tRNA(fMet)-specific endonuclease VapC